MGVTSFSGSTSSVSFSFKPTATNSNITALKFNSNNQPNFEHTFVAHDNVDKGWVSKAWDETTDFFKDIGEGYVKYKATQYEIAANLLKGAGKVVEGVADCAALGVADFQSFFGFEEASQRTQNWIAVDQTSTIYDKTVGSSWISEYSFAPDWLLQGSEMVGTVAVYAGLNAIPGVGTAVSTAVGVMNAGGASAQTTLQMGGDLKDATITAGVAAGTALISRGALKGVNFYASASSSAGNVVTSVIAGAAASEIEPVANNAAQYFTYGKDLKNSDGTNMSYFDYARSSGLGKQMVTAGAIGGIVSGSTAMKTYSGVKEYRANTLKTAENRAIERGRPPLSSEDIDSLNASMDDTIKNVRNDYLKNDVYNKKYNIGDILTDEEDQLKYWSKSQVNNYFGEFGKNVDADGNIKVYTFQNGDISNTPVCKFGGDVGYPDGCFVTSEVQYQKLINDPALFDKKIVNGVTTYVCKDYETLGLKLGNVPFENNNIIVLEQTVRLDEIKVPNASYSGAYPGDWCPGGKTIDAITKNGGCIEAVVNKTNYKAGNVNIISLNDTFSATDYISNIK